MAGANIGRMRAVLWASALLVPLLCFAVAAAWSHGQVYAQNRAIIVRTAAILHEHARKVFDTAELVVTLVDSQIVDQSWEQIGQPSTSAFLRRLKAPYDQVVSIWIADRTGLIRAGSDTWEPGGNITEREFFKAHVARDIGTFISKPFTGKATATASFAVSRRKTNPEGGGFDGTIHVALSPAYFAQFYQQAAPPDAHAALLFRQDGEMIVREPPRTTSNTFRSDGPVMQAIAANQNGSGAAPAATLDGLERLFSFAKVAPYPVFVGFGINWSVIAAQWRSNVVTFALVAAAAMAALMLLAALALRYVAAEQAALVRLSDETAQRLRAERNLAHAQRVESIGQLTGGVAHDFNNLLAVILGNLDLLKRRQSLAPREESLVDGAIQGAERGAALTQRLLSFARRQDLTPQPTDVAALIEGLADLIGQSLGATATLHLDLPQALAAVQVDRNQLELAILNLCVNSRDAMPGGGVVTLAARDATVREGEVEGLRAGRYVAVAVSDTGEGMPPDVMAKATDPFFTTKEVGKGTGLGLSMVQGLALQSGGALRIKSAPGVGTTVEILLPLAAAPVAAAPGPAPAARPADALHKTVLVVDDDPLVLAATSAMAADLGHTVLEASSGPAALDLLAKQKGIEVVVTDHVMPGMTGLELAERLRAIAPGLRIILASGHVDLGDGRESEITLPRLTKPFRREDLAGAIDPKAAVG